MTREEARELLRHRQVIDPTKLPFIEAFANGETIQFLSPTDGWGQLIGGIGFDCPAICYRIAPKPLEFWVNVYPQMGEWMVCYHNPSEANDRSEAGRIARVHLREVGREEFKK